MCWFPPVNYSETIRLIFCGGGPFVSTKQTRKPKNIQCGTSIIINLVLFLCFIFFHQNEPNFFFAAAFTPITHGWLSAKRCIWLLELHRVNPAKEIRRDLMRRTPFQSVSDGTIPTGPFRNRVKRAQKTSNLPKTNRLQMGAIWGMITLRSLTLRARVKRVWNAQIARWSVGYFRPAKLDSGNIPRKSPYHFTTIFRDLKCLPTSRFRTRGDT